MTSYFSQFRRSALLAVALLACAAGHAAAQRQHFQISAGFAPETLREFMNQSKLQLLFDFDAVRQLSTQAVSGELDPIEALSKMLAGTGFSAQFVNERTVTITVASAQNVSETNLKLVQKNSTEVRTGSGVSTLTEGPAAASQSSAEKNEKDISEIVVTGTNIRGVAPAGSPVISISREQLDQSGRGSTQEFFRTVLQNFAGGASEYNDRRSGSGGAAGTAIDLRGLGASETLVLLNGRRLAPSGAGDFVDISAIPMSALSSVDILTDGASATYGSDAVAGVVNFHLRTDLQGAETRVRFGSTTGGGATEYLASHIQAFHWSTGRLLAGAQYHQRDPLFSADRDFAASADLRPFGGTDQRDSSFASPGNISSPSTLAGAIPIGNGLTLTSADILRGQSNKGNPLEGASITPEQKTYSGFFSLTQNATDRIEIFTEGLVSRREIHSLAGAPTASLSVPSTNAYRIANGLGLPGTAAINVNYSFVNDLGAVRINADSTAYSARLGAGFELGSSWKLEAYGTFGETQTDSSSDVLDQRSLADGGTLATALASSSLATAFNPFSSGGGSSATVLNALRGRVIGETRSDVSSLNLKADGELFDMPGGTAKVAVGGEYRHEGFDTSARTLYDSGVQPLPAASASVGNAARDVSAVFAEVYLPVVSSINAMPLVALADISASVRYDSYSDFGRTTNPKIGARWSPGAGFVLRGSWGTSFRAPLLSDLNSLQSVQYISFSAANCCNRPDRTGNGLTDLVYLFGGNPNLDPEEGETWTLGFDFEPQILPGLKIAATYYDIEIKDRMGIAPAPTAILANTAPYEGVTFIRAPTEDQISNAVASAGTVIGARYAPGITDAIIAGSISNISVVKTHGVDLNVRYGVDTAIGRLTLTGEATKIMGLENALTAASPLIKQFDIVGRPIAFQSRLTAALGRQAWSGSLAVNYKDSYTDNLGTTPIKIDSNTTVDLYGALQLSNLFKGMGDGWSLSASLVNLFDKDPPFTNSLGRAWDGTNYTPLGRAFSIEVGKRW